MNANKSNERLKIGNLSLGVLLIILGGLFLLGRFFDINIGHFVWPFFIIIPGALIFVFSLILKGSVGVWMNAGGSIVVMTGALLLYQNTFNHFESWAYAWALVAPTSIGLGKIIYGTLDGHQPTVQSGKRLTYIGGAIFLVSAIFFELIIGISGFGLGSFAGAILLIGLGIFFLLRGWLKSESATESLASDETDNSAKE